MGEEIYNLAFDFGASNGRLMLSKYDGYKISLEEIYRFPNEPVRAGGRLYWDFLKLFSELKVGLKMVSERNINISSIGIDTWGVDYGLLDKNDRLISNPVHYRDSRTNKIPEKVEKIVPFQEFYNTTGIQFLQFNTVYQLYDDLESGILRNAKTLLFMPDLFSFYLTGEKYNEYTISSTSQMLDANKKNWSYDILDKLCIAKNILQEIIMPGNIYGCLSSDIRDETGLPKIPVIAVGCHDTASAVAGTPLSSRNSAYLSCGTWSLLGIETQKPIIDENSLKFNFTNEGGVLGTIRFLKNITGLWLIQQLRRSWANRGIKLDFPDIISRASSAKNANYYIDPDDELFMAPDDMGDAICRYCMKTGQGRPDNIGDIARAAYNGITKHYKETIEDIEKITGNEIDTVNIVGGGIRDEFLLKQTAGITGRKILAGPVEASILGNCIIQLMALKAIKNLDEGRNIIKNSFPLKEYKPMQ
ncbi:MAG: rhamnulokinase family protein [Clostridiales bacterium]|nr:rhamnulokinase family protein [Clostridiales bacterium]